MERPILKDMQTLRRVNALTVLDTIRGEGPISRRKLARVTGLSQAAAFVIVDELVRKGLVREVGLDESAGGRRPRLYSINSDAPGAIGVEVRRSRVIGVLLDLAGNVKKRAVTPLASRQEEDVTAAMKVTVADLLRRDGATPEEGESERVVGVGVAMPGIINTESGVAIRSSYFGWSDLRVCEFIRREFGLLSILEHNVRAQALGETWFGAGKDVSHLVCVNVGAGISAGIVINNELYRGQDEWAGELGHICVDEDGPRCGCGGYGCLEALASEAVIVRKATRAIEQGADSLIARREDLSEEEEGISFTAVINAANQGDALARGLLEDAARYLGIGIAIAVNLLNPKLVVVGGEITEAWELVGPVIEETVKARALRLRPKHARISRSALGVEASSIGAATLVLRGVGLLPAFGASALAQASVV